MNAYELAKELDKYKGIATKQASDMLRKQADRIAHLEMLVANRNEIIDKLDLTAPQIKELSDEEIIEIGNAVVNLIDSNEGWIEFAKAILKKASKK